MNRTALFVIESDPRRSGRPAEAVRIAAGVGAWKKIEVTLYLRGAAALILSEQADALVNGENYERYLPLLRELGRPVYLQEVGAWLEPEVLAALRFEEISDEQLAAKAADCDCVLRF